MSKTDNEGRTQRSEEIQLRLQRSETESQQSEPFNLLKRVILLEERTRQFEESQVHLSFLEQRVDEIVEQRNQNVTTERQRLIYDLEKKVIIIDDKVCSFENNYNKLFKQIQNEIQGHLEQPQSLSKLEEEISQLFEIVQNQDKTCQTKWLQLKEELERNNNNIENSLKDLRTKNDTKKIYDEAQKKEQEDSVIKSRAHISTMSIDQTRLDSNYEQKRQDSNFDHKRLDTTFDQRRSDNDQKKLDSTFDQRRPDNTTDHKRVDSNYDQRRLDTPTIDLKKYDDKEYNLDARLNNKELDTKLKKDNLSLNLNLDNRPLNKDLNLETRMLSFNKDLTAKASQQYLPSMTSFKQQQMHQIKQKEEELDLLRQKQNQLSREPARDLSGYRTATKVRPNPYKQRDLTNIRERQQTQSQSQEIHWETDIKMEQTKRFIDEEINRRFKEDQDKKGIDQRPQPYSSLREQLNLQYQKKYT